MSIQGHLLDITVVGCTRLKDTEWLSRQDPYVILEYASSKYRTKTDTDGGRNPTFNEKYSLPLIEGLREIDVAVWNSNTVSEDDFIGSGKIHLQKVLTEGYDDSTWPLTSRSGKRSGEVRIILHYSSPKGKHNPSASTAPPMCPSSQPSGHLSYPPAYTPYPPAGQPLYAPYTTGGYPPAPAYGAQLPPGGCPPGAYPPPGGYPPQPYPPQAYPYPPGAYPPQAYPYPPQGYPPQHGYGAPPPGSYPPY
eukprot:c18963_g1_i2 orf=360-1106(-)